MIPLIIEFLVHSDLNNPQVSPSPNVILKEVPYRILESKSLVDYYIMANIKYISTRTYLSMDL